MWVGSARISHTGILASVSDIEAFSQAELTTWPDDRGTSPTVGYFLEDNTQNGGLSSIERPEDILKICY